MEIDTRLVSYLQMNRYVTTSAQTESSAMAKGACCIKQIFARPTAYARCVSHVTRVMAIDFIRLDCHSSQSARLLIGGTLNHPFLQMALNVCEGIGLFSERNPSAVPRSPQLKMAKTDK